MKSIFQKLKDNLYWGLTIGMLLPAFTFVVVTGIKKALPFLKNDDLLYIACVAVNIILVQQAFKVKKELLARGIVGATFICALIFVYYKLFFRSS